MKTRKKLAAMLLTLTLLATCMAVPVAADDATGTKPQWAGEWDFSLTNYTSVFKQDKNSGSKLTEYGNTAVGRSGEDGDKALTWKYSCNNSKIDRNTGDNLGINRRPSEKPESVFKYYTDNGDGTPTETSYLANGGTIVFAYDFNLSNLNTLTCLGALQCTSRFIRLGLYAYQGKLYYSTETSFTAGSRGTEIENVTLTSGWHRVGFVFTIGADKRKSMDVYLDDKLILDNGENTSDKNEVLYILVGGDLAGQTSGSITIDNMYLGVDTSKVIPKDNDGVGGDWTFDAQSAPPANTKKYNNKPPAMNVASAGKSGIAGDYAFSWKADKTTYASDDTNKGYLCRNNGYGLIFGASDTAVALKEDDKKPWGFQYDFKLYKTDGVAANLASVQRTNRYMSLGLYVIKGKLYYAKDLTNSTAKDAVAIVGAPEIKADTWYTLSVVYNIKTSGKTADIYLNGKPICIGLSTTNQDDPTGVAMALASTTGDNTDMYMYIDNLYLGQDLTKLDIEVSENNLVLGDITDDTNSVSKGISASATQLNLQFTTYESGLSGVVIVAQKDTSGNLVKANLQNVKFDSLATTSGATKQYQKVLTFDNLTIDNDASAIEVLIWQDLTDLQPWFDTAKISIPVQR